VKALDVKPGPTTVKQRKAMSSRREQLGSVAIVVGLSATVLFGFAGVALDMGRLYVNKSELQTAADACALAAAAELTCDSSVPGGCPASFLENAEAAGIFLAGRSLRDFQLNPVVIPPADVKFSTALAPNSDYLSRADGASTASRYAMCTARSNGLVPWFMSLLGAGPQAVTATAVATRAPSQSICPTAPVGLCSSAPAPGYGFTIGQWIVSDFTSNGNNDNVDGDFRWVDFTPNAGGNSEIRDQIASGGGVCNVRIGDDIGQPGQQQGAKSAWNTRFGLYPNGANAYTPQTAPPDRTGYAYPNKAPGAPVIPIGTSAYADYRARQGNHTSFINNEYGVSGAGGNIPGNPITSAQLVQYGTDNRINAVPIIDCAAGNTVPIRDFACVLMLNPMSNGATGKIYLEYRGLASAPGSPCRTGGYAGGPASTGPQVPTLVQ
jgi:Flp pilus assembly protein TadG